MSAGHLCGAPCPDPIGVMPCSRPVNHAGHHRSESGGWPNADELPRTPPSGPSPSALWDTPALDPVKACALESAAHWHIGSGVSEYEPADVVRAAEAFEAYLRGGE